VIAFGCAVRSPEAAAHLLAPGLALAAEPDSPILESTGMASVGEAYDEILRAAATLLDLEALVLVPDTTEVRDARLAERLRAAFADPSVAVVGVVGASHVTDLLWWEGGTAGRLQEAHGALDFGGGTHDVHVVDGAFLALSPAVVHALRPDPSLFGALPGFAAELCWLARSASGRVLVTDLDVVSHAPRVLDGEFWRADAIWRTRWSWAEAA
jgi:hypothetical protein